MKTLAIALITLLLGVSLAAAEVLDPALCTVEIPAGAEGASVFVVPNGAGESFTNAFLPGGDSIDATVTVTLVTNFGNPVVAYPAEDLWIGTDADGLVLCGGAGTPDGDTDVNGQTTWTASPAAGGSSAGESLIVYVAGVQLPTSVDLLFNSADLNGDLQVNLSDISVFTQALGVYDWAADFNNDGVVNLSDISRFVPALGAICP